MTNIVKECGSGVNDPRPQFLGVLADPPISRFGVASIQMLLAMQHRELVIVNTTETAEEDLVGDKVALVTSFCARLYGRRRAKRKTEQVLQALEQNGL